MAQRYTVFLNDKAVIFCNDSNKPETQPGEICIQYTDKQLLETAYNNFSDAPDCPILLILTGTNFTQACLEFNSLFQRIEAAGGIVRNNKGEYLFIKRLGIWDLPKGKLHKNESREAGALREVTEETGLIGLTIARPFSSSFHIYTNRAGRAVLKETYWFEMICHEPQTPVPQTEEDITEVKWFSPERLDIPLQNTYASLRSLWKEYLQE